MNKQNRDHDEQRAMEDFGKFWRALEEESRRGWILGAHSYLDELLKKVLESTLEECKSTKALLGGPLAPIGSFGARLHLARALGLLTDSAFSDFKTMTKIRNEFAHDYRANHTDDHVADRMDSLDYPYETDEQREDDSYVHFQRSVCWYAGRLLRKNVELHSR